MNTPHPYPELKPAFQEFWTEFLEEQRLLKDYYLSVSRLILYIERMEETEREAVLEGLLCTGLNRHTAYKQAWSALKHFGIPATFIPTLEDAARQQMNTPIQGYEEAAILADMMLLLARRPSSRNAPVLHSYLTDYPVSPYWTQVVWAFWPDQPEPFFQAWRRYFLNEPEENWKDTRLLDIFFNNPETIPALLEKIRLFSPDCARRVENALEERKKAD